MKKLRKVDGAKRKAERRSAEALEKKTALLLSLPEECCVCQLKFERTHETVTTWNVTVYEEKNRIRLTCPECWGTVQETIKEIQDV